MSKIKAKPKFKNYILVVTCVVIRNKPGADPKVLIIKRSRNEKEGPGLWTIPGGKIEPPDWVKLNTSGLTHEVWVGALERGCRRELWEETNLMASKLNFLAGEECLFFRKSGKPTVVFRFWTQRTRWGKVHLDKNGTAHRWITSKDLDNYKFIGNVKNDIHIALNVAATQ